MREMIPINLLEIANKAHSNAKRLGKLDNSRNAIEKLKDVQSEYMEAMKALNIGDHARLDLMVGSMNVGGDFESSFEANMKDTYEQELTDMLFVILTLMVDNEMDIQAHVNMGLEYNEIRGK